MSGCGPAKHVLKRDRHWQHESLSGDNKTCKSNGRGKPPNVQCLKAMGVVRLVCSAKGTLIIDLAMLRKSSSVGGAASHGLDQNQRCCKAQHVLLPKVQTGHRYRPRMRETPRSTDSEAKPPSRMDRRLAATHQGGQVKDGCRVDNR